MHPHIHYGSGGLDMPYGTVELEVEDLRRFS